MINYYKIIQPVLYYALPLTQATRYHQKTHFTLSVSQCSLKAQWILQIEVFFHGGAPEQPPDFCDCFSSVEGTDENVDSFSGSAAEPPQRNARIHAPPVKNNFKQCVIRKRKHLNTF